MAGGYKARDLPSLLNINIMQRHHCLPLSLHSVHYLQDGSVNEANLVLVTNQEHNTIHEMLNIPYGMIREFIKHQEWKLTKDLDYYQNVHRMQQVYFSRLGFLPQHLQSLHAESIKKQCVVFAKEFNYRENTHQDAEFLNDVIKFGFYHSIYFKIFSSRC